MKNLLRSPSAFVTIDGQLLEYTRSGTGTPAVVLVNGAGGPMDSWFRVFEPITRESTVVAYNRPGLGRSAPPSAPQTGPVMLRDLQGLLAHAQVTPPFVLVGHSLGGLLANLFARTFPGQTAGVVLLDAATPEDVLFNPPPSSGMWGRLSHAFHRPHPWAETQHVEALSQQVQAAGAFPAVPLVVLSGTRYPRGMPKAMQLARTENQVNLARLSPLGEHHFAHRSGHFPQFTESPLVVEAIRLVLSRAVDQLRQANARGATPTPE